MATTAKIELREALALGCLLVTVGCNVLLSLDSYEQETSGGAGGVAGDGGATTGGSPNTGGTGGAAASGGGGDGGCAAGVACGGECIDIAVDPDNCGVCDHVCESGTCAAGLCEPILFVDDPDITAMAQDGSQLYYLTGTTSESQIDKINKTTKAVQTIMPLSSPRRRLLAVDDTNVYFATQTDSLVLRLGKSGGSPICIATSASSTALFPQDGWVVIASTSSPLLRRVPRSNTACLAPETIVSSLSGQVRDIDGADDSLYVAAGNGARTIYQVTNEPLATPMEFGDGVVGETSDTTEIVRNGNFLYWSNASDIRRKPINVVETATIVTPVQDATSLDTDNAHVYWFNEAAGVIRRAPLEGGAVEDVAMDPELKPPLFVDGAHVYWLTEIGIKRVAKPPP